MPTLYVVETGARLEKEHRRLLVTKDDEVLLRVPLERVSQVVLVGAVGVTTPALYALLGADVPLLIVRRTGQLVGRLLADTAPNLPLRQAQYRRNDDAAFCMDTARAIVLAKIHNQCCLALRILRHHKALDRSSLQDLYQAQDRAASADELASLLGIEGAAARAYFRIYRQAFADEWAFTRRTRRPPKDPVNALLSLGYTLLGNALMTALEAVGLDPYLGYFHTESYGRPALALDLLEEFRAPLVDSLVMGLINRRMLKADDFDQKPPHR